MRYLTGFLSPRGEFVWCPPSTHLETSSELCNKYGYQQHPHHALPEDTLLCNGWICLRMRDIYKSARDVNGNILPLSQEQQAWLHKHRRNFNVSQMAHVEQMIRDYGSIEFWHKA